MKTKIIFLLFMITFCFAFGQDLKVVVPEVNVTPPKFAGVKIEKIATMPGSIDAYLRDNLRYPDEAAKWSQEGTEVVQFVITPEGKVTDFVVINSISPEIDEEVISVLQTTSGMWKPGYNNDQPVSMEKEVSIVFRSAEGSPDFHKTGQMYFKKGSIAFLKDNPEKAISIFDKAIVLLPNDKSLLLMRGLARFEIGDKEGASRDWNRLKTLGNNFGDDYLSNDLGDNYLKNLKDTKGYAELTRILEK